MALAISLDKFKERDCATCTASQKERWGCDKDLPVPLSFDGEDLFRCPRRPLLDETEDFSHIFNVYGWYKNGMLPDEGTWRDQPNKFVQVMTIMDRTLNEAERQNMDTKTKAANKPKVKIV